MITSIKVIHLVVKISGIVLYSNVFVHIKDLLQHFWSVQVSHVYREVNKIADAFADLKLNVYKYTLV